MTKPSYDGFNIQAAASTNLRIHKPHDIDYLYLNRTHYLFKREDLY